MILRDINPFLRRVCKPFDFEADDAAKLARRLSTSAEKERGIGLAAPQIGIDARAFVMKGPQGWVAIFNPEIVEMSTATTFVDEGCLSFPGLFIKVKRHASIGATWFDIAGTTHEAMITGDAARIFQHEFDHLNGKLFTDGRSMAVALAMKKAVKRQRRMAA